MRLASVNVALPREVNHAGRVVRSGIFKQPVDGPVRVHYANLAGDAQADPDHHGGEDKAVYAFALEQYDHWRGVLGRGALPMGQFGENLTIAGLDESVTCVGDRLRAGSALLVVTQPRVPCFKLGIRLQHADAPKLFSAHAWTGVYLRVAEEGMVAAGDAVAFEQRAADGVPIRALFQAFTHPQAPGSADVLRRALALPDLAAGWRPQVQRRLEQASWTK